MLNLAQMSNRSRSAPLLAIPCYQLPFFHCRVVVCPYYSVFVRWLGGFFAKLGISVGLCGFANVPPNTLANCLYSCQLLLLFFQVSISLLDCYQCSEEYIFHSLILKLYSLLHFLFLNDEKFVL